MVRWIDAEWKETDRQADMQTDILKKNCLIVFPLSFRCRFPSTAISLHSENYFQQFLQCMSDADKSFHFCLRRNASISPSSFKLKLVKYSFRYIKVSPYFNEFEQIYTSCKQCKIKIQSISQEKKKPLYHSPFKLLCPR